jgi:rod shape-determining protein MreD
MTRGRFVAAATGIVTALLLQASVIGPALAPLTVSLPALLVAAVALVDGPATGMSFGFTAGLAADLGSRHPAGILALCWLAAGLLCGTVADHNGRRRDALTAGFVTGLASVVAGLLVVVVHQGGTLHEVGMHAMPSLAVDLVLAVPVVALVRRMLRTDALRAPHPVVTEFAVGPPRG